MHDRQRGKRRRATEREEGGRGRRRWGEVREGEKARGMNKTGCVGDSLNRNIESKEKKINKLHHQNLKLLFYEKPYKKQTTYYRFGKNIYKS